jgi:hypothetical protein
MKERIKNIILNDGESFGLNSDLDSRSVVRSRRSGRRRKKSDLSKNFDDETFNGLRGSKKKVFEILKVTFTEMRINSKTHADFLNSDLNEAKVLRVILEKKFEINEIVKVEKLKMKKEKKRNEEINKFVVKRCMKYLMKRNRDKSINKIEDISPSENKGTKDLKNNNTLGIQQESINPVLQKGMVPQELEKEIGSLSNISIQQENIPFERNITFNHQPSKMSLNPKNNLDSQSEFMNLNYEAFPESSVKELSFVKGVFGPKKIEALNSKQNNFLDDLKQNPKIQFPASTQIEKREENEPKENNKMVAHSKLLSEHQFYLKYFNESSKESSIPLEKYYLPNTKLANNANRENKGNKEAQSYKTINIKYIRLILHSKYFSKSIKDFLNNVFEYEYRETRIQKLRLLAQNINNAKYVKSVKLPWTMHEILEAKTTFSKLIETTEKDIYGNSNKKKSMKGKKKKKEEKLIGEPRMTRSRTRKRNVSPQPDEDNFQACFANSQQSNKFLGN